MDFKKLTITTNEIYKQFTNGRYLCSEASFANMYIWRNVIDLHFAIINNMLVLRLTKNGKYKFIMPFGDDGNINGCIDNLMDYCTTIGQRLEIIGADSNFISIASKKHRFVTEEIRNQRDYIYSTEKLAKLSGKKLHSKKNHVNKFKSTYNYEYKPLISEDFSNCIEKTRHWLDDKYDGNEDKYKNELSTIEDAFHNFSQLSLFGGAIFVDGELVAYTVGEELTPDTVIIHIEKADRKYAGAFAMINYEFQNSIYKKYKYVNREEDMGIEGLRKAKLSYQPEFLTEKYACVFNIEEEI